MSNPTILSLDFFEQALAPRPRDAHKHVFGHVLVVGGNDGMVGAARLAAEAALRVGAGLVSVVTQPEHLVAMVNGRPEIMAYGVTDTQSIEALLKKASAIAIGMGLGQTLWSKGLWEQVLLSAKPKVIDADALHLLAQNPRKSEQWVLTPHAAEAATLLNCDVSLVQKDRQQSIKALQHLYGGVIILKGFHTLVCSANSLSVCHAGNPGMASAGMGDLLSGVISGLLAQGFNLRDAAELGVYLHATAGDLAAQDSGERGLLASDLLPYLHRLVNPPV